MRLKFFFIFLFTLFCALLFTPTQANNISVSNVSFSSRSTNHTTVQFDISWDNSWRASVNYDAAWVFMKYSTDAGVTWQHCLLGSSGTNPGGFSSGTGTPMDIVVPADRTGAFLQMSKPGYGTLGQSGVQLDWNGPISASRVKVFAIEMVYIPSGAFYLGDGACYNGNDKDSFFDAGKGCTADSAVTIGASAPYISDSGGNASGDIKWQNHSGDSGDLPDSRTQLNSNFPTGYHAFYLMKYEISQGQYRDFLNTLTRDQQNNRTASQASDYYALSGTTDGNSRNGIRCPSTIGAGPITFGCDLNGNKIFNESDDGEWIASNFLSDDDLLAYADWAGLRPMTELEFEKSCRGPLFPLADEYAWGSTDISWASNIEYSGAINEYVGAIGNGLCNYGGFLPLRCGFAATGDTVFRAQAGAGYYGNMELSGNLAEYVVPIGSSEGRGFTGSHGNGSLTWDGFADTADWPYSGGGRRGGSFDDDPVSLRISDRSWAFRSFGRDFLAGGRACRTAP